jgi:hypothetical protein
MPNLFLLWLVLYFQRKRGRPAGSKFAKTKVVQKPALFDSSSGRSSHTKGGKDNDFEPPNLMVRLFKA